MFRGEMTPLKEVTRDGREIRNLQVCELGD